MFLGKRPNREVHIQLCGGFQCKGVPRYRSAYVIDRSRMMYRAGMGDLSFSKTRK